MGPGTEAQTETVSGGKSNTRCKSEKGQSRQSSEGEVGSNEGDGIGPGASTKAEAEAQCCWPGRNRRCHEKDVGSETGCCETGVIEPAKSRDLYNGR